LIKSRTFRVSKVINAPLRFVYDWCTDFRGDDNKIWGSNVKRIILQKTRLRVIYMSTHKQGRKSVSAVRIVTLRPPNAWHLDLVGQQEDEIGDYRLTRLGPGKTRLDMRFNVRYKIAHPPTKEEDMAMTNKVWDRYVAALERDHTCGR
jgi:hypothetical protein